MNKKTSIITLILVLTVFAFTIVPAGATPTTFSGTSTYYTYAVKSQEVLQDLDCPATAELTFLDGTEIELALTEGGTCGGRTTVLEGKITPSGKLKVWFPDPLFYLPDGTPVTIEEMVKAHTGCTGLAGPFPVYHGSFDGQNLVADTTFNCKIPEYWPANDLFPTPVDGQMHWQWTIDLTN